MWKSRCSSINKKKLKRKKEKQKKIAGKTFYTIFFFPSYFLLSFNFFILKLIFLYDFPFGLLCRCTTLVHLIDFLLFIFYDLIELFLWRWKRKSYFAIFSTLRKICLLKFIEITFVFGNFFGLVQLLTSVTTSTDLL